MLNVNTVILCVPWYLLLRKFSTHFCLCFLIKRDKMISQGYYSSKNQEFFFFLCEESVRAGIVHTSWMENLGSRGYFPLNKSPPPHYPDTLSYPISNYCNIKNNHVFKTIRINRFYDSFEFCQHTHTHTHTHTNPKNLSISKVVLICVDV